MKITYFAPFLKKVDQFAYLLNSKPESEPSTLTLSLHSQSIVTAKQDIMFAEVLSEIQHDGKKLNMEFISSTLEQINKISWLDLANLKSIVAYINKIKDTGELPEYPFSVNISAKTIEKHHRLILEIVQDVADFLIIEITEREPLSIPIAKVFCSKFKELGGIIALDDFNENIASCSEIYKLELLAVTGAEIIKLNIPKNIEQAVMFLDTIDLIRYINPNVLIVLEKVESQEDLNLFNIRLPGALYQGYFVSSFSQLTKPIIIEY